MAMNSDYETLKKQIYDSPLHRQQFFACIHRQIAPKIPLSLSSDIFIQSYIFFAAERILTIRRSIGKTNVEQILPSGSIGKRKYSRF